MKLARFSHLDARITRACNRYNVDGAISRTFALASRLGDGIFWYALMIVLPLASGRFDLGIVMALTGACATAAYKGLKAGTRRLRPCEEPSGMHLTVAPLDRYSFPSGHTLHAVTFTVLAVQMFPVLGWLLIPFTIVVALSRLVLGLHYPSDVLVGAAIGAAIASTAIQLTSLLGMVW